MYFSFFNIRYYRLDSYSIHLICVVTVTEKWQAHIPSQRHRVIRDYHGNRGHIILLRGSHSTQGFVTVWGVERQGERECEREREQLTEFANVCLFRDSEGVLKFQVSTFTPLSPSQIQRADLFWKITITRSWQK